MLNMLSVAKDMCEGPVHDALMKISIKDFVVLVRWVYDKPKRDPKTEDEKLIIDWIGSLDFCFTTCLQELGWKASCPWAKSGDYSFGEFKITPEKCYQLGFNIIVTLRTDAKLSPEAERNAFYYWLLSATPNIDPDDWEKWVKIFKDKDL